MENERIVIDENVLLGQAHVKETRLTVKLLLGLLAAGEPIEQILEAYTNLKKEDILACLKFAEETVHAEWKERTGYEDLDI